MATVDDNIVRLRMDDRQFDKASDKTISKLEQLKQSLKFDGAAEGFESIEKAAKAVDLSPMEKSVQMVGNQFNALATIADTVLRNITTRVSTFLESGIKSLSVDNITAGWSKYGEKTTAVQTIMAATAKDFEDTGEQMKFVEGQLEKLNWYTDETSYSFLDMVDNIGKFTSNQVPLDQAVTSMQGIANWAAISGANVGEAGRAMYNLSQAISSGSLKLLDWMSIENANMGTAQFKEIALAAGETLGTLKKVGDGVYQTLSGTEVSVKKFRDTLSEGWLNSDVLLESLDTFGSFTNALYEMIDETTTGIGATAVLGYMDDFRDGTLDMEDAMISTGMTADELTGWLEKLTSAEYELGEKAFRAGQESKTFKDAVDATKDAVSSGWMKTFEYIFGNYEEAKELWSEVAEGLYTVFVESGNVRNGLMEVWKELGGREVLLDAFRTVLSNLYTIMETVKDAFHTIFPQTTVDSLMELTYGFARLADYLTPTETTLNNIGTVVSSLARIFKSLMDVVSSIVSFLSPVFSVLNKIAGVLVSILAYTLEYASFKIKDIVDSGGLEKVYDILRKIGSAILEIGKSGFSGLKDIFTNLIGDLNIKLPSFSLTGFIDSIKAMVPQFDFSLDSMSESIVKFVTDIMSNLRNAEGVIGGAINLILDLFEAIFEKFNKLSSMDILDIGILVGLVVLVKNLSGVTKSLTGVFDSLSDTIGSFAKDSSIFADTSILQWAALIGTLTYALSKLSTIPLNDLIDSLLILGTALGAMLVVTKYADKIVGDKNNIKALKALGPFALELGAAMLMLTKVVTSIAALDPLSALQGVIGLGLVLAELAGFTFLLKKMDTKSFVGVATSMLILATALTAMIIPVGIMGSMKFETIAKGLTAVAVLLLELSGTALILKNIKAGNLLAAAIAFDLMAPAIVALTIPIMAIGSMDLASVGTGLLGIAGAMATLAAGAVVLSNLNPGKLLASALAIDMLSVALVAMTLPVKQLAALDTASMIQGILGVIAMLGSLTIAMAALSAISTIGGAGGMIASSAAILLISVSLNSLVPPILALSQLSWESLGKGLLGLAGGLGAVIAAGAIATVIVPGLTALTTVLLSLAAVIGTIALASFAIGFMSMSLTIAGGAQTMIDGLRNVVDAIAVNADLFPRMIDMIFDAIGALISRFLLLIPALIPQITLAAVSIMRAFMVGIAEVAPDIFRTLLVLLQGLLQIIVDIAPDLIDTIVGLINALADGLPKIVEALKNFLYALGDELLNIMQGVLGFIFHSLGLGDLWDWLFEAKETAVEGTEAAMEDVGKAIKDGDKKNAELSRKSGENQANEYLDAYDKRMDRHSPPGEVVDRAEDNGTAFEETSTSPKVLSMFENSAFSQADTYISGLVNTIRDGIGGIDGGLFNFMSDKSYNKHILGRKLGLGKSKITESKKDASDAGLQIGEAYDEGFASGLSGGSKSGSGGKSKAEEKAKTVAEQVEEAYKSELESLEAAAKKTDLEYNLWEQLNVDIDETQKKARQIEYINAKIVHQIERMRIAGEKYDQILEGMGEDAIETKNAYNEWLQEQIDLETLQNELYDLQNEVIDKNAELLEKIEQGEKRTSQAYKLWTAMNQDATDAQKAAAELANLNNELGDQVQRTQYYAAVYNDAVAQYGPNSKEALEAYDNYVSALTGIVEKQNEVTTKQKEMVEAQNGTLEDQQAQFRNYVNVIREQDEMDRNYREYNKTVREAQEAQQYYNDALRQFGPEAKKTQYALEQLTEVNNRLNDARQNGMDQQSLRQSLLEQGFTQEEVNNYFMEQVGMQKKVAEETVEMNLETLIANAQKTAEALGLSLSIGLETVTENMAEVGSTYAAAVGTGMTETTPEVVETATKVIYDVASNVQSNNQLFKEWDEIGYMMDMGIKDGIERGESEVINAIIEMVQAAIAAAQAAAGIHSPSTEGFWMGEMIDLGLARGLEADIYKVVKASQKTMWASLNAMADVVHTSNMFDFTNEQILGGITRGYDNYSAEIVNVSAKLLSDLDKEIRNTTGDYYDDYEDFLESLGYGENEIAYHLVVDLDTSKADEDLTDLERSLKAFEEADFTQKNWWGTITDAENREKLNEWLNPLDFETYRQNWLDQKGYTTSNRPLTGKDLENLEAQIAKKYEEYLAYTESQMTQVLQGQNSLFGNYIKDIVDALKAGEGPSAESVRTQYVQNIYSPSALNPLTVYRNTNKALAQFRS